MKTRILRQFAIVAGIALAISAGAQTVTNPNPNRIISWNLDDWSTINPNDLAGLAPATNWVDTFLNNITVGLPDNSGAATTLDLGRSSFNTWHVQQNHPGLDANGTANRELLNGYLNAGPAAWNPPVTNTFVSLTNIPYARYDVVVYFNSDTSGRHASIDNGSTTYYFSTVGSPSRSGANALFLPTSETDSSKFPSADFAFFPGMTAPNAIFTETPKSGNDQWLGIAAFQVIESSNVYVLYGPSPGTQIVPLGQPAAFNVMAGGLNPHFQWRHAGIGILNATNATYAIASTSAGQDGNYDVVINNAFSSITSAVATLTFYSPKIVTWAGVGSAWDTTSLNWTLNGGVSTTNYTETDHVLFGPLGAGQPTAVLGGTLAPGSITISNGAYMLTSGGISGPGSLRVRNNATLILDTVDTRTGPTLIDSGSTLQLDNGDTAGSLGSGAMTNNGALVFNAAGDEAYGYPVYGTGSITNMGSAGTITLGNNLSANYLAQAGSGILLLQGSNSLTGGLVVSSGTVWARAAGCLGQGPVQVNGGELQLIFSIDFTGSAMTLGGGLLHGGIGGFNSFAGAVSLAADSSIQVDGGNNLTLPNPAGLNGNGFNLTLSGAGTLILAGTNNSWASVSINGGALQIGNGGPVGGLGGGTISTLGNIAFNLAGDLVVTNPITGSGAINQIGTGTVTLTADHSAAGFGGPININSGTLLINGTSGFGSVSVAGTLGGTGTIGGPVAVVAGGTLSPGASIGTLTMTSDLNLGGNLRIEVNRSLAQSNDLVVVSGFLQNTGTGVVTVNNLGPALSTGNTFQLFSQPMVGGETLTVVGGGMIWTNKLATDGTIQAIGVLPTVHPVITQVSFSASPGLVFSGTNGIAGYPFYVLSSTNLASTSWATEASGTFDANGNFAVTNSVSSSLPKKFYRLQLP